MVKLKRAYDNPAPEDGFRVLVERLWPRGVSKGRLALDLWLKGVAPSTELRQWFAHDPEKWDEFQKRYWTELEQNPEAVDLLRSKSHEGVITLVYAARDEEHNGALALKHYLDRRSV
jgi:uncharacterized protein YeaO (DUF488 family)